MKSKTRGAVGSGLGSAGRAAALRPASTGRSRAEGERGSKAVGGGERGVEREKGKQRERELGGALWRWSRGGEERAVGFINPGSLEDRLPRLGSA